MDIPGCLCRRGHRRAGLHDHRGSRPRAGHARGALAGFAGSAVLLAAFIGWERRASNPMLDVRLFRNLRFSAASVGHGGVLHPVRVHLPGDAVLPVHPRLRPASTGVRILPVAGASPLGAASARCWPPVGTRVVVTRAGSLHVGFAWIAFRRRHAYGVIVGQMVLMGLGLGLTQSPATDRSSRCCPRRRQASARRSTTPPARPAAPWASPSRQRVRLLRRDASSTGGRGFPPHFTPKGLPTSRSIRGQPSKPQAHLAIARPDPALMLAGGGARASSRGWAPAAW